MLLKMEFPVSELGCLLRVCSLATEHSDYCSTDLPGPLTPDFSGRDLDTRIIAKLIPEWPEIYDPARMPETGHHDMPGIIRVTNHQWCSQREQIRHGL